MSVTCHTVGFHILIHFAEQVWHFGSSACTGSSGLGIHDQGIHIDHTFFYHRVSGQDRAGGITAGISHQSGLLRDLVTVDLAESVYRFLDELRRLMLDAVPFFIGSYILDTVISGQIHNFHLGKDFLG